MASRSDVLGAHVDRINRQDKIATGVLTVIVGLVILLVVLSAPIVRNKLSALWKKIRSPKQTEVEVAK